MRIWGCDPAPIGALADDVGLALGECAAEKGNVWALFFSGAELGAADYYPALTSPRH